jgi:hypothetical protein
MMRCGCADCCCEPDALAYDDGSRRFDWALKSTLAASSTEADCGAAGRALDGQLRSKSSPPNLSAFDTGAFSTSGGGASVGLVWIVYVWPSPKSMTSEPSSSSCFYQSQSGDICSKHTSSQ